MSFIPSPFRYSLSISMYLAIKVLSKGITNKDIIFAFSI